MIHLQENVSIKPYTTFGIDAKVKCFVAYENESDIKEMIRSGYLKGKRTLAIGGGSNLLFCNDYDGVVLHSKIKYIEVTKQSENLIMVRAGSGVVWDDLVAFCVEKNFYGAENLSAIPGSVGATAIQNIGAYGVEAKDLIFSVECIDMATGEKIIFQNEECKFGYRDSVFKHEKKDKYIVTAVNYKFSTTPNFRLDYGTIRKELQTENPTLAQVRETIQKIRDQKLPNPQKTGNAGSFFKNPIVEKSKFSELQKKYPNMPFFDTEKGVKIPAAWFIEQCGWKGKNLGNAGVYEKQPLVLINCGGATGSDVIRLSNQIQQDVKGKFDVEISPEVIFVS